jgi:hypothetical protein
VCTFGTYVGKFIGMRVVLQSTTEYRYEIRVCQNTHNLKGDYSLAVGAHGAIRVEVKGQ